MLNLTVPEIAVIIQGRLVGKGTTQIPLRISTDTRTLQPGDLFFAIPGDKYDGHQFIHQAVEKQCAGVVVQETVTIPDFSLFCPIIVVANTISALAKLAGFYRNQYHPITIAVTGSNGKSTVKELIALMLNSAGPTLKTPYSWNNHIGIPLTLLNLNNEHQFIVCEIGTNHFGEIKQLVSLVSPQIGVITNIGASHLEHFGTIEGVYREKISLFSGVTDSGIAIINLDDRWLKQFQPANNLTKLTYSLSDKTADVCLNSLSELNVEGKRDLDVFVLGKSKKVATKLTGSHNVSNILAAITVCVGCHIDLDRAISAMADFTGLPMRMESIKISESITLINDSYNANPDSMRVSLTTFVTQFKGKKKIVVLGDMYELGEHSRNEHCRLGEFVARLDLETVIFFGQEVAYSYSCLKQINNDFKVLCFTKPEEVVTTLKTVMVENSAVLFKASRRMKLENIITELVKQYPV